jgi:hypothetical protein
MMNMTDQLDTLFKELSKDVDDDGFSDQVLRRIERPHLMRRGLSTAIYVLTGVVVLGPGRELLLLASENFSTTLTGMLDVGWMTQSPVFLVPFLLAATLPAIALALND